ncbi:putative PurR-regulated permease PerM [Bacillus mesophilus]|uniref:AI-2E family transporter n=1 Tax=Bacillus mesophilus TaxID=1808955 RepID=A0A6M0Q3U6_9BACI|nr:AI-2E family transporter [Bacillus mesophilus]MBM7660377.1 putative PurR-regulated permease PerM [Bacillus mesophilus]NEY71086.1 AI-2E family transporter [Bacillus mesophilus]
MEGQNKFLKLIGGKNVLYLLAFLILVGITIYIYTKISFIFYPLKVILSTIAPPVILAFVAYYLLNPVVEMLERFRIKKMWGIIILILGISGALTGVILLTAPSIEAQVKDLVQTFPSYLKQLEDSMTEWAQNSLLAPYYDDGYNLITERLGELPKLIGTYISSGFQGIQNVASTITTTIVSIVTFPFILFFLLKDGKRFQRYTIKLFPPKFRDDTKQILNNIDTQVGSYIQGQIIVATVIGILLFIGYLIIGLEYAFTLAIVAAVTSVVPYLGPTIAIIPAVIIAIVNSPFMLLKLGIVWIAVQFLEGNFVSPNIMGKTMKVHPLTIILVLLIAGNLFGVIGVIFGIPGYAIVKVIGSYLFYKFMKRYNKYYGDDRGYYEIED